MATVENSAGKLSDNDVEFLLSYDPRHRRFIEQTFSGIFFTPDDLRFLDRISWNMAGIRSPYKRAVATAALIRSCVKRQPRGVFTVAGDPDRYKDGRRDLQLSLKEHFVEQVAAYNGVCFENGRTNRAIRGDVFDIDAEGFDLVYLDPPYVPRADDNCYIKRYHFLEGLSSYWKNAEIVAGSRVKKLKKPFTPFSYRRTAIDAFERLFTQFARSTIVLSYSSNGFPDLAILTDLMRRHKRTVTVFDRAHRYHFGTHSAAVRNDVREYLVVGRD